MSLRDKLKAAKPLEKTVEIDGDIFLVRGLSRIRKNELASKCTVKGTLDNEKLEACLLAECVCDPATGELVMSEPTDWDVPAHIAGPLVKACIECCGFDRDEAKQLEKK